jgi:hypothetical protein
VAKFLPDGGNGLPNMQLIREKMDMGKEVIFFQ